MILKNTGTVDENIAQVFNELQAVWKKFGFPRDSCYRKMKLGMFVKAKSPKTSFPKMRLGNLLETALITIKILIWGTASLPGKRLSIRYMF